MIFRNMVAAFALLTRIPVGGFPFTRKEMADSVGWYPAVGFAVGTLAAGGWFASWFLPPAARATMAVAIGILATGALHEDGLADTADAWDSHDDLERFFTILKDSRVGTYGSLALTISVLVHVALVSGLGELAPAAMIFSHAMSRAGVAALLATLPYITPAEVVKNPAVAGANARQLAAALLWILAAIAVLSIAGAVSWQVTSASATFAMLTAILLRRLWRLGVGGITGDLLGATQQVVSIAALVGFTWMVNGAVFS